MKKYCNEWFFKRFGSKNVATSLFQDFILNLKNFANLHERFSFFGDLLGIEIRNLERNQKTSSNFKLLDKLKNKSECYKTYFSCSSFLRIVRTIKSFMQKELQVKYLPNFPNCLIKNQNSIKLEMSKNIIEKYLLDIGYTSEKIANVLVKFDVPLEKNNEKEKNKLQNIVKEFINFDKLCRFLLDKTLENKIKDLDKLYTSIKLRKYSFFFNRIITIDDYAKVIKNLFPNVDENFISSSFSIFIENMTDFSNVQDGIIAIIPWLLSDYQQLINKKDPIDDNETFTTVVEKSKNEKVFNKEKQEFILFSNENEQEFILETYDYINSLGLLQETYLIMKPMILSNEKKNEILKTFHLELKENLLKLPKNIAKMEKFNEFESLNHEELIKLLENSWTKFREILSFC